MQIVGDRGSPCRARRARRWWTAASDVRGSSPAMLRPPCTTTIRVRVIRTPDLPATTGLVPALPFCETGCSVRSGGSRWPAAGVNPSMTRIVAMPLLRGMPWRRP